MYRATRNALLSLFFVGLHVGLQEMCCCDCFVQGYMYARNLGFAHRFIHINYREPLFLGLGFMFLGLGFGTIVFAFGIYVFRIRVLNHCL